MDASELAERIRAGENLHTEFKAGIGNANDLACEIVAFANTDGGQLVVGVSDDGDVVGVPDPDAAARAIDNVAYSNCRPRTLFSAG
ncbi:MAG: ATP-binding protein [Bacillota bacterium]|nr:ATP-binding protein [Bacillota bacterium]